ncbi:DUF4288 domain-containing protein [Saccharopolyspora rhizosphaerae]|uniref:DUF4288 domain-containing protein n=1 Tax=Saccharopolyspora rhizosphaerae TaxID=2492662 RepID=A0A3R8NY91_9PSEU|nr:DUF4288 domain-containing protein [Saccharopolyspora rhizosphaerae]RRO15525.1 DUF4288 domain-containing protein [Saccharopolyspora rhizosphaerae]
MSSEDFESVGSIDIGPGTIDPRDFQQRSASVELDHYVAVLLLEAESEGQPPLYEESFVLLTAESAEEATEKAKECGKQQETSYEDENHRQVTWRLKHIVEVKPLEDATFDDGTELFSRFFRNHEAYRSLDLLTEDEV